MIKKEILKFNEYEHFKWKTARGKYVKNSSNVKILLFSETTEVKFIDIFYQYFYHFDY